ncbi:max dimerization protein 3 isoform X1 [Manacus candei]|uniref:max dimerization protein 3 isoform X1 n=1 Tax=Manacus candei TaxID=415023 RepID=UPI002227A67D|nr:max dimerization protein 3 isoform X1 [Manacus candei]
MEPAATTSIQVLLQAAEFLEHRDHRDPPGLAEAEHGYASLCPARSRRAVSSVRSVHNALEKHRYRGVWGERRGRGWLCPCAHPRADRRVVPLPPGRRRAQLRCCLERLKQQVPVAAGPARPTTLSLLHRARLHIQRLEEQELRARRAKDRLRDRQRSLRRRLEWLLLPTDGERARADSLDSSQLSEPSEGGKGGEGWRVGRKGKAAGVLTWAPPLPVPRGCRGRGGWCGVRWGPAARLRHREGPQLLQPPQPGILTVPTAFPALPACLLPAGNAASPASSQPG